MSLLRVTEKMINGMNRASMAVACLFLCVLTALVAIAVLFRYVFNAPVSFAEEISQYMLLGIVFLGFGFVMHNSGHIRVDVVFDLLPLKMQKILTAVTDVAAFAYAALMTAASISLFSSYLSRGSKAFTILETPLIYPCALLIIGSALFTLEIAIQIFYRYLTGQNSTER